MDFSKIALGIELGSTRIKAVAVGFDGSVAASGSFGWENSFINGVWTYSMEEVVKGVRACYADLREDCVRRYGEAPSTFAAIGVSAMMHGYIALDAERQVIAPFQTWRNENTGSAAAELTEAFGTNIPLRWSIAHLYQRILDREEHLDRLAGVCTLAAYVHELLTGESVLGSGDASGMFPLNAEGTSYDPGLVRRFESMAASKGYPFELSKLFPRVLPAGERAGSLTSDGAALLDDSGVLRPGIPFCPPEGDAGTGMVATNSVAPGTGNLSAGTSAFAMVVLEKPLKKLHRELDNVTTPDGRPVAMSHANNGTGDIDAWAGVFSELLERAGARLSKPELYDLLYGASLDSEPDCSGVVSFGYLSGEFLTGVPSGAPSLFRRAGSDFTLASLMRSHVYAALAAVRIGLDIMTVDEGVKIRRMLAHGGLFKSRGVAQKYFADAINAPVDVMPTAGEGGPWGMALLAAYSVAGDGLTLPGFLDKKVFSRVECVTEKPTPEGVEGFNRYLENYKALLPAVRSAAEASSD
ncbi:MAG: ATPase [Clostridia bacterium]|nr:ATPase [Clostridia bacterium]